MLVRSFVPLDLCALGLPWRLNLAPRAEFAADHSIHETDAKTTRAFEEYGEMFAQVSCPCTGS